MKRILLIGTLLGALLFAGPEVGEARLFKIIGIQEKPTFLATQEKSASEELAPPVEEPGYYVDAGREQGMEIGSLLNVYRYVYIDDPSAESTTRMKLLIGTMEVVAVDDKTSLARVSSTEPMKNLTLDFKRFMVSDAVAPALKLDSAVMFAPGKADLAPRATQELQKAAKQIQAISPREIVIEGHTDNVGDPKVNYQLSLQRAENVKSFLVRQGVPEKIVKALGYGDTRPVAPNDTEENKQKNRRIEVVFWE